MSLFSDRNQSTLLVIDTQVGVITTGFKADQVTATIADLITKARASAVPVVWVQHNDEELALDSDDWQIVEDLQPAPGEARVRKQHGDSFEDTDLAAVLSDLSVGHLVVVGAQTDACIRSTIHGAFTRGYDVTLVADAHTTDDRSEYGVPSAEDVIAHTNLYWQFETAPGRIASVVLAADVAF